MFTTTQVDKTVKNEFKVILKHQIALQADIPLPHHLVNDPFYDNSIFEGEHSEVVLVENEIYIKKSPTSLGGVKLKNFHFYLSPE